MFAEYYYRLWDSVDYSSIRDAIAVSLTRLENQPRLQFQFRIEGGSGVPRGPLSSGTHKMFEIPHARRKEVDVTRLGEGTGYLSPIFDS